jgi:hypothetical protein
MTQTPSVHVVTRNRPKVMSVTGHEVELMHDREREYYETARDRYKSEFSFTMHNDLRALDRLLLMETQMWRAQWQLAGGQDYDGVELDSSDEIALRRAVKELAPQIADIQKDLGLTKAQRENDGDTVAGYIQKLRVRAKEHGVRREKQLGRAMELINELFAIAGSYKRSNENERRKLGFETGDDVVDWVLEVMQPRYNEIDDYFREHQQKFWIRDMS